MSMPRLQTDRLLLPPTGVSHEFLPHEKSAHAMRDIPKLLWRNLAKAICPLCLLWSLTVLIVVFLTKFEQEGLAVASVARDDPSPLLGMHHMSATSRACRARGIWRPTRKTDKRTTLNCSRPPAD